MNDVVSPGLSHQSLQAKSTLEEIRQRFDHELERFSQLEKGQQATVDAPLVLELVAEAAATHLRAGDAILDLGCGAGNFTLRVLQKVNPLVCHLVDLSGPMLERARQRIGSTGTATVHTHHTDLRKLDLPANSVSGILAGASLHHLREEGDWADVFAKLHFWLKPGGRLYVADLVTFDTPEIQHLMWNRYGRYLEGLGGVEYREKVFAYIEKEDSPRSLPFQLDLLRRVGFSRHDVLHRNQVFACYFAAK